MSITRRSIGGNYPYDVAVVSDGEHDKTNSIVEEFAKPIQVQADAYTPNRGKGFRVRTGSWRSGYSFSFAMPIWRRPKRKRKAPEATAKRAQTSQFGSRTPRKASLKSTSRFCDEMFGRAANKLIQSRGTVHPRHAMRSQDLHPEVG